MFKKSVVHSEWDLLLKISDIVMVVRGDDIIEVGDDSVADDINDKIDVIQIFDPTTHNTALSFWWYDYICKYWDMAICLQRCW